MIYNKATKSYACRPDGLESKARLKDLVLLFDGLFGVLAIRPIVAGVLYEENKRVANT